MGDEGPPTIPDLCLLPPARLRLRLEPRRAHCPGQPLAGPAEARTHENLLEQSGHQCHLLFLLLHLLLGGKGPRAFENSAQGQVMVTGKDQAVSPPTPPSSESVRSSENPGGPVVCNRQEGSGESQGGGSKATAPPTHPHTHTDTVLSHTLPPGEAQAG